jgi:hypothetical protein
MKLACTGAKDDLPGTTGKLFHAPPQELGNLAVDGAQRHQHQRPAVEPLEGKSRCVGAEAAAWSDEPEAALIEIAGQRLEQAGCVDQIEIAVGLQELRWSKRFREVVIEQAGVAARPKPGVPLRRQPRIFGRPPGTGAVAGIDGVANQNAGHGRGGGQA